MLSPLPYPFGSIRFLLCQICLLAGRVNNQGRLGWGEGSPGKLGTIAGEARYRHQPGDTVGSAHPKGGGRARPEPPICARAERVFPRTSAGRTSFLSAHRRGILNIQSLNELTPRTESKVRWWGLCVNPE